MRFTVYRDDGISANVADPEFEPVVKQNNLMKADLDQFAVTEDGHLIILDECGRFAYVPGNYRVMVTIEGGL